MTKFDFSQANVRGEARDGFDFRSHRMKIALGHGLSLSVVAGASSYSTPREFLESKDYKHFEIALINQKGNFVRVYKDMNDDVLGWVTAEEIQYIMDTLDSSGGKTPIDRPEGIVDDAEADCGWGF